MRRAHVWLVAIEAHESAPEYELRMRTYGVGDDELEVWRLPAPATPHVAGRFAWPGCGDGISSSCVVAVSSGSRMLGCGLASQTSRKELVRERAEARTRSTEHLALMLGLLLGTCTQLGAERGNMLRVAEGIEAIGQEEAAYWLGMAMHRTNPRRVLSALQMVLNDHRPGQWTGGDGASPRLIERWLPIAEIGDRECARERTVDDRAADRVAICTCGGRGGP